MLRVGSQHGLADTSVAAVKTINDAGTSVHCSGGAFWNDDFIVWLSNGKGAVGGAHEYACANQRCFTQGLILQHALMVSPQNGHFPLVLCLLAASGWGWREIF
jgi:hypothetical protein